jgi:RTX calcium-binding nonapeptide repeat (4 copies)
VLQAVETDVLRGIERVNGSSHSEIITGNELDNSLSGQGGDDLLAGGGGNDFVSGGSGNDTYDFRSSGGAILGTDQFFDESGLDTVIINDMNDILSSTREQRPGGRAGLQPRPRPDLRHVSYRRPFRHPCSR